MLRGWFFPCIGSVLGLGPILHGLRLRPHWPKRNLGSINGCNMGSRILVWSSVPKLTSRMMTFDAEFHISTLGYVLGGWMYALCLDQHFSKDASFPSLMRGHIISRVSSPRVDAWCFGTSFHAPSLFKLSCSYCFARNLREQKDVPYPWRHLVFAIKGVHLPLLKTHPFCPSSFF